VQTAFDPDLADVRVRREHATQPFEGEGAVEYDGTGIVNSNHLLQGRREEALPLFVRNQVSVFRQRRDVIAKDASREKDGQGNARGKKKICRSGAISRISSAIARHRVRWPSPAPLMGTKSTGFSVGFPAKG
jgi:hypothetical protein